jgi:hypothetical protein
MSDMQRFIFEACKDLTLIILMVAAAISLTLGMTTEVFWLPLLIISYMVFLLFVMLLGCGRFELKRIFML